MHCSQLGDPNADRSKDVLMFFVNGKKITLRNVDPAMPLSTFLRRHLRLTGTKIGCEEGSCGSCTVMISSYNPDTDQVRHKAMTSCLVMICTLHGMAVTTIEGLGNFRSGLHVVQERLVKYHGTQCGFCTPGMVMSMYTLLRNNPHPTLQEITTNLHGNVCRCTGYRSIVDAFGTFSKEKSCTPTKGQCCSSSAVQDVAESRDAETSGTCKTCPSGDAADNPGSPAKTVSMECRTGRVFDPTQELIFPPELKVAADNALGMVRFDGDYVTWFRPYSLEQAVDILAAQPHARIAAGCTQLAQGLCRAVDRQFVVDVSQLPELRDHVIGENQVVLGAALTMSEILEMATRPQDTSIILSSIPNALGSWHNQLKNSATLGGHLMMKTPKQDLLPLFVAAECFINTASSNGSRRVPIHTSFCEEDSSLRSTDILVSVDIPVSQNPQFVRTYKVAKRKRHDFASLNAAFVLDLDSSNNQKVTRARMVFGGSLPALVMATKTQTFLTGRTVSESLLDEAVPMLMSDLTALNMSSDQLFWARGFLTKCVLELLSLKQLDELPLQSLSPDPCFQSKQVYEINRDGEFSEVRVVGQPLIHSAAEEQSTGEAIFVDDIAPSAGELSLQLVLSTKPHANVTGVDLEKALSLAGVVGHVGYRDVPGVNSLVPRYNEEPLFAKDTVKHCGQAICGILAEDRETAQRAADLVQVSYEDKSPVILSIEEAIAAESFVAAAPQVISKGDTAARFSESDEILEGEVFIKGQRHFYMETQSALAFPKERGEIELLAATQMPSQLQIALAAVLGVSSHKINVRVKRLGGAFGGKETRSYLAAIPAAVAAVKYQRPVRCVLSRKDDTLTNGGRHPLLVRYKVGFKNSGKILSLELKIYSNGGCSQETSKSVMKCMLLQGDGAYSIPAVRSEGRVCITNLSSKGPFRAYGAAQMFFVMENIITQIATRLNRNADEIRDLNLRREGETSLGDVYLKPCELRRCWEECKGMADYRRRLTQIEEFNRKNTLKKRGIALQPCMFNVGYFDKFMNQAGALVHVYTDGSVLVTHGGCEMGQGLHTKIKQIASETLGIEYDKVLVSETATYLVPNTIPTSASVTTDLNGAAVHAACLTLLERLRPFREADPSAGWDKWVDRAYFDRVSLSVTGFSKYGDFGYDFEKGQGPDCSYHTYGVGCSEVELDCLTGEHKLIRTDIVMDVGRSLNPAIDIGQIEGGFTQGYGLYMLEEQVHDSQGKLLTDSFLSYKVPLCSDIPAHFNVALLKNSVNKKAIYSSKGIGEPPLILAISSYLALREAVQSARKDRGLGKTFSLPSPATSANVVGCLT